MPGLTLAFLGIQSDDILFDVNTFVGSRIFITNALIGFPCLGKVVLHLTQLAHLHEVVRRQECIVTGIGGILYVQNRTGAWASWAYVWALIPGFVGIGLLIAGTLGHKRRKSWREGGRLIVISAVLFLVFGAFFNGLGVIGQYWPVLLIGLGLWQLLPRRSTR